MIRVGLFTQDSALQPLLSSAMGKEFQFFFESTEDGIRRLVEDENCDVVILDLNRFKLVNDRYGHLAGDSLLKQFSQELRANLRSSDLVGRWSGDEFMAVLDCDLATAQSQIARMRQWVFGEYTLQLSPNAGKAQVTVDAAVGVAQWKPGESIQAVIECADTAMYEEKKLGRKTTQTRE